MKPQPRRLPGPPPVAFSLVEMIGVLAIIAILASLLIPRVFQAIGDARISNAANACNRIKASVNEYYGRYGFFAGTGGKPLKFENGVADDWDRNVLMPEGLADKPFAVRLGNGRSGSPDGSRVRALKLSAPGAEVEPDNGAYNLDGSVTSVNDIAGTFLVEALIEGVRIQDARDFNDWIDGTNLGAAKLGDDDLVGRVKYFIRSNKTASIRVYLAHR